MPFPMTHINFIISGHILSGGDTPANFFRTESYLLRFKYREQKNKTTMCQIWIEDTAIQPNRSVYALRLHPYDCSNLKWAGLKISNFLERCVLGSDLSHDQQRWKCKGMPAQARLPSDTWIFSYWVANPHSLPYQTSGTNPISCAKRQPPVYVTLRPSLEILYLFPTS